MADGSEGNISGGEYGGFSSDAFGGGFFGTPGLGDGTTSESDTSGGFDVNDAMDVASMEALSTNPAHNGNWDTTAIPNVETDFMDALQGFYAKHKGTINALGKLSLGLASKSNPVAALASSIYSGYNIANNPQGYTGGVMGNLAGSSFGPVSGMLGGIVGANTFGGMQATGKAPEGNTNAGHTMDYMDLGAGLGSLYLQGKNARQTSGLADNLASLYTQDSPFAQMLRQQLVRQDAQGGRRSQYGNREVELQAKLAELNSRNAPQLNTLRTNANLQRMQQLNQLWALQRMGGGKLVGDLYDKASAGLGNMYNYASDAWNSYMPATQTDYSPQWYGGEGVGGP